MNIGLLFAFRNPPKWHRPYPEFYAETFSHMVEAERLGYDMIWLTEHHFSEDGYSPSVLPIAAAVAAQTSRIRIGTMVLLLPLHNAVRVAEDAATVDVISNGRFELGVGLGYTRAEFEGYGIPKEERASRFEESLAVIKGMWTTEPFSFKGKHYDLKDIRLTPMPVQKPHLPIWSGGGVPKAIDRVARLGFNYMGPGIPEAQHAFDAAVRSYGHDPEDYNCSRPYWCYVAETKDQAWADIQEHLHYMIGMYNVWLKDAGDGFPCGDLDLLPPPSELRHIAKQLNGMPIVGSPDDVAREIEELAGEARLTHLSLGMHLPGLDMNKSLASMRLFASEVMPRVRASVGGQQARAFA